MPNSQLPKLPILKWPLSPRLAPRLARQWGLALPVLLLTVACSDANTARFKVDSWLSAGPLAQAVQGQPQQVDWAAVEQGILAEQNRLRQNPQSYVPILEEHLASMDAEGNIANGCGPRCTLVSQEGRPAVEEAIAFLRNQPAVEPLTASAEISQVAKAHAQDQSDGTIGHTGSDGRTPAERLSSIENLGTGENIAYGPTTAESVIMSLIIDDGVPDRGHRKTIFSTDWTNSGVGCGPHAEIGSVCVINYVKAPKASAGGSQFQVTHNGTVDLLSLKVGGVDILGGPLAPGRSRSIALSDAQACEATLTLELGGNYQPLNWENLYLCDAEMTIDGQNRFQLQY
jgi:uncharacterized protein YkwD